MILSEQVFRNEHEHYFVKALDCAFRALARGQRTGIWRYDGEGINAVRDALEIHDEQIKHATKGEIRAAFNEVNRRLAVGQVYAEAA